MKLPAKIATITVSVCVLALGAYGVWRFSMESQAQAPAAISNKGATTDRKTEQTAVGPKSSKEASLAKANEKVDGRALYLNESADPAARFQKLSDLADAGKLSANHFRLQIVADCELADRFSADSTVKNQMSVPARSATEALTNKCASIKNLPDYSKVKDFVLNNPRDLYELPVRAQIQKAFADGGVAPAISTSLDLLKDKPDETTIATIYSELNKMDIAEAVTVPAATSGLWFDAGRRGQILSYALELMSCDYGRDCGAGSSTMLTLCAAVNQCEDGANLQQLMQDQILNGADMHDVQQLIAYLQSVPSSTVSGQ